MVPLNLLRCYCDCRTADPDMGLSHQLQEKGIAMDGKRLNARVTIVDCGRICSITQGMPYGFNPEAVPAPYDRRLF